MNVVITGLAPRDETVLGFFLNRALPSWNWQNAPVRLDVGLPSADLYVIDLGAWGLAHGSVAAHDKLIKLLQGRPAVLLLSGHDRSWSAVTAHDDTPSRVWLSKPYGTQTMQAALEKAAACIVQKVLTPPAPPPPIPAPPSQIPAPPILTAPAVAPPAQELTADGLATRLSAITDTGRFVLLRQLSHMLSRNLPFEVRFTVQNSLIVHPDHGWIATNTPLAVIQRVCLSDAMASAVTIRKIDSEQAEERAQRLGMPPSELEIFLAELVATTLELST